MKETLSERKKEGEGEKREQITSATNMSLKCFVFLGRGRIPMSVCGKDEAKPQGQLQPPRAGAARWRGEVFRGPGLEVL